MIDKNEFNKIIVERKRIADETMDNWDYGIEQCHEKILAMITDNLQEGLSFLENEILGRSRRESEDNIMAINNKKIRRPVTINGETRKLEVYPELSPDGRKILDIQRTTPSYFRTAYQDGVEDWAFSAQLRYENEFYR